LLFRKTLISQVKMGLEFVLMIFSCQNMKIKWHLFCQHVSTNEATRQGCFFRSLEAPPSHRIGLCAPFRRSRIRFAFATRRSASSLARRRVCEYSRKVRNSGIRLQHMLTKRCQSAFLSKGVEVNLYLAFLSAVIEKYWKMCYNEIRKAVEIWKTFAIA